MNQETFSKAERETIRLRFARPADELAQALIAKGIIDEHGHVLVRMPDASDKSEKPQSAK